MFGRYLVDFDAPPAFSDAADESHFDRLLFNNVGSI